MASRRSSRTAATCGSSAAPFSSNGATRSGISPSGVCSNASRMSSAIGIFVVSGSGASMITSAAPSVARVAAAVELVSEQRRDEHEPEHEPSMTRADGQGAAPGQADVSLTEECVSVRQDEPEAGPADRQRRSRVPRARGRQQREPHEAAREEDASADGVQAAGEPGRERPHGEGRQWEQADDAGTGEGPEIPHGDDHQNGQEQRPDERGEEEDQRDVRGGESSRAGARGRRRQLDAPQRAEDRERRDRGLGEEDRAPVEQLGEKPAGRRPERRAERSGRRPDGDPASGRARRAR